MSDDNKREATAEDTEAFKHAQEALRSLIMVLNKKPDYWSIADAIVAVQGVVMDMRIDVKYPDCEPDVYATPSVAAQTSIEAASVRAKPYAGAASKAMQSLRGRR